MLSENRIKQSLNKAGFVSIRCYSKNNKEISCQAYDCEDHSGDYYCVDVCVNNENKVDINLFHNRTKVYSKEVNAKDLDKYLKLAFYKTKGKNMKNFKFKDKIVTASSRKEAIAKIVASEKKVTASSNKEAQDFIKDILKDYIEEDFLNEHIDDFEDMFDKELFWNNNEKTYENNIYKDYRDDEGIEELIKSEDVESFDEYWEKMFEAYHEAESNPFFDLVSDIKEYLEENEAEDKLINDNDDDMRFHIQDKCPTNYPEFLGNTITAYILVKNTPNMKKKVYGSSSNISIATKCVKHKFSKEIEESLISAFEDWSGDKFNEMNEQERIKDLRNYLDFEDKHNEQNEILYLAEVDITIEEYLSIKDKDNAKNKEIDIDNSCSIYLNYGTNPYYVDEVKVNLSKLSIDDIIDAKLKDFY